MKVAYNNCFGGFGLSPLAVKMIADRKGIDLFVYHHNRAKAEYTKINNDLESYQNDDFNVYFSEIDLGENPDKIEKKFSRRSFGNNRIDEDLISVIEELGEKASGACAKLAIAEIPDDARFEIEEYYGKESVYRLECLGNGE